jgi:hypothetical protein
MSLGGAGDASGTIGWIVEVGRQFTKQGWSVFLDGDQLKSNFFGAGLMDPVPVMNPLWRSLYIGVTRLGLSSDNYYDTVIAIQFVFAGLVGWYFAATFGVNSFWRFVFVLLMMSVENTALRMAGHNGLIFAYGPMLSLAAALRFARLPTRASAVWLVFTLWFSFLSNEYLGYFGFWSCLSVILSHDWGILKFNILDYLKIQLARTWPAIVVLVCLFCLSHPTVSLFKIKALFQSFWESSQSSSQDTSSLRLSVPSSQILFFGLKNPLVILDSWFVSLPANLSRKVYGANPAEFTYRWGLILPLFIWWTWRREKNDPEKIPHKAIILTVSLVMLLFALRTDLGLSLGWVTRIVAPMFRVGVRAQFISLIAMILLFTLCAQWFWERRKKPLGPFVTSLILAGVVSLSLIELARSGPVLGQHAVFPVSPLVPAGSAIAKRPPGMTLMVPTGEWQESENYFLSTIHGKPVLNTKFGRGDSYSGEVLFLAAGTPSLASRQRLERCGVRYLIVNLHAPRPHNFNVDLNEWSKVPGMNEIFRSPEGIVFELNNAMEWPLLQVISETNNYMEVSQASDRWLATCTGVNRSPSTVIEELSKK